MHSTWRALLENIELMSHYHDFGFQPPLAVRLLLIG
jgi:hypothetical protein